ncbi:HpcH/HpaI aldolase family protein [Salinicola peritrichatus]|uniref:HpcH/HpaI aldolase family protein n=1 Tax=Salinicola peritrichatus TaxID=1267424 RepID=UPI000DA12D3C|nr:aldolase/citrate lyase family protein [Salinicola peritrichatus]
MACGTEPLILGTWVQINSPELVELVALSGFDFAILDMEHGNIDFPSLEHLIRASESRQMRPVVRVTENDAFPIMKALDLGAKGVLIPQVETPEEARRAVQAAKYAPLGTRGACPFVRAGGHLIAQWEEHAHQANRDTQVIALIESKTGVDHLDAIVATPGLDAFMIGPFDLSVSLGIAGQVDHPLIHTTFDHAMTLAHHHQKTFLAVDFQTDRAGVAGMLANWRERGVTTLVSGADKAMILTSMRTQVRTLRQ